ncbi:HTTM domain-containing protein [Streptomyces sp. NPDC006992]|uniref:HTTM domain-containing protein n=1 Tax=Streptomyces sp. NPDC006992 TaxID=3155601 RepID=UPI003401E5C4
MGVHGLRVRIERCVSRGLTRITAQALGPYQTAIVRIGFGAAWLLFLLREWPHRQELYGPDSPWSWGLAERLIETNDAFSVLMWSSSDNWFQLVYVVALAAAAAVLLGWHTRAATVLFMVGVLSLQNRSVFMGDGGDNVIHLMSMYLVFTRCAQVWSLDARRAARARRRREAAADHRMDLRAAEPGADAGAPAGERPAGDLSAGASSFGEAAGAAAGGSTAVEAALRSDANANANANAGAGAVPVSGAASRTGARPAGADVGADAGVGGVVLWTVFGAVLLGSTVAGGFTVGWALFYWGLWALHGLWWSVQRAAARGGAAVREMRDVCDILANLVHNGVLLVIMIEVCLVYSTAGWFKIQGTRWQDGTAVYYPMNLDYFTPWPDLSHLLAANGVMVFLVTYGTVATQVAFPFTLLNRRAKNVLLAFMIAEHLSIAVLLGLPFFSLAMIAADAVFLPTVFLIWLGRSTTALGGRARDLLPGRGRRAPQPDPEPAAEAPKVSV